MQTVFILKQVLVTKKHFKNLVFVTGLLKCFMTSK